MISNKTSLILILPVLFFLSCSSPISPVTSSTTSQPAVSVDDFFTKFSDSAYWQTYKVADPVLVSRNMTFASGIIRDILSTVFITDTYVFISGYDGGYSYFEWKDFPDNVKGNIKNYKIVAEYNYIPGNVEWAQDPVTKKIYAYYWDKILDALTGKILFDSEKVQSGGFGPLTSIYGVGPNKRFIVDNTGTIWLGASQVIEESEYRDDSKYGLFKINTDGTEWTSQNLLPGYDVWRIFKDSNNTIWVSALDGVHKYTSDGTYEKVFGTDRDNKSPGEIYDHETEYLYCEDIIEYNGNVYFLMKNFFARPEEPSNRTYALYIYDGSDFKFYLNLDSNIINSSKVNLIVLDNNLYIISPNSREDLFKVDVNKPELETTGIYYKENKGLGQWYSMATVNNRDVVAAVSMNGFIFGLRVFNFDDKVYDITQSNTSTGLLSNDILDISYDNISQQTYITHGVTRGFTIIDSDGNFKPVGFEQGEPATLFTYKDQLYLVTDDIYKKNNQTNGFDYVTSFRTNNERTYLHNNYLWSIVTRGQCDDSNLFAINLDDLTDFRTNINNSIEQYILDDYNNYKNIDSNGILKNKQIYDIIGYDNDNLFISCGSSEDITKVFPYILKYSYSTNTLETVSLPNENEIRIKAFAQAQDGTVYALGVKGFYKYDGIAWKQLFTIQERNFADYSQAIIEGNWMFVVSRNNGIDVIHLSSLKHKFYNDETLGINGSHVISFGKENGKSIIWYGTANGLKKFKFGELVPKEN